MEILHACGLDILIRYEEHLLENIAQQIARSCMIDDVPEHDAVPLLGRARSTLDWLQRVSRHSFDVGALHLIRQRRSHLLSLCSAHTANISKKLPDLLRLAEYNTPTCCISPPDSLDVSEDELDIGVGVFAAIIDLQCQKSPRLGISRLQKISEIFPAVCSRHGDVSNILSIMYYQCFENHGLVSDLDEAIKQGRSARALADEKDRAGANDNLFSWWKMRLNHSESTGCVDWDELIEIASERMGGEYGSLKALELGAVLEKRCQVDGDDEFLKSALNHHKLMLQHIPPENVDIRPNVLNNLGSACLFHFQAYRTPQYVMDAIDYLDEAKTLNTRTKADSDLHYMIFTNLGLAFAFRFAVSNDGGDIVIALQHFHQAGECPPEYLGDQSSAWDGFSRALDLHRELTPDLAMLDASLRRLRDTLKSASTIHQTDLLRALSRNHLMCYERTGYVAHLDFAIEDLRGILDEGIDQEDISLCHLAVAFERRFERLGRTEDLEHAFTLLDCGRAFAQPTSTVSLLLYNALGLCCRQRFLQSGSIPDLDSSIAHFRTLLTDGEFEKNSSQKEIQSIALQNLGTSLSRRYIQLGNVKDIAESVVCIDRSMKIMQDLPHFQQDHLRLSLVMRDLAISLNLNFQLTRNIADIEQAIRLLRKALEDMEDGHHYQDTILLRLAECLQNRFDATKATSDLNEVIECTRRALKVVPPDSLWRPSHLSKQGAALLKRCDVMAQRHTQLGEPSSLTNLRQSVDEAIQCYTEAIELAQPDSSWQDVPEGRYYLGLAFLTRFNHFNQEADLTSAINQFRLCARTPLGLSDCQLRAAVVWAVNMHDRGDWESAHEAYSLAIPLLSEVAWMGLDPSARLRELSRTPQALANDAAACAIQLSELATGFARHIFMERAVESLDHGRSVFWSQGSQLEIAFEELHSMDVELVQEFRSVIPALQSNLHNDYSLETLEYSGSSTVSEGKHAQLVMEQKASNRRALVDKWEGLISRARSLPGLENFMRPLPFSKLCQAADRGPIIIVNSSRFRQDAMIIDSSGGICLISLDPPTMQESLSPVFHGRLSVSRDPINERAGRLVNVTSACQALDMLWRKIARPVLDKIDDVWHQYPKSHTAIPRVWWCLTGSLTSIPIHAAQSSGGDSVLNRIVSSYTSTLSALLRVKQKQDESFSFLVVAQSLTPGQAPLPGVAAEMEIIRNLPGSESFKFFADEDAKVSKVAEELSRCTWAHFACHGCHDKENPLQSALIMHDGPLHVSKLSQLTPHAEFAMLLACETAKGEHLPNEAIHIVASFQFAGFRSVIGTSSEVQDTACHKVAQHVYKHLFRNGPASDPDPLEAAEALRAAVLTLRMESPDNLAYWAPFIHFGA